MRSFRIIDMDTFFNHLGYLIQSRPVDSTEGKERITSRQACARRRRRIVGKLRTLKQRGSMAQRRPLDIDAFAAFLRKGIDKWPKVVRTTGMTVK